MYNINIKTLALSASLMLAGTACQKDFLDKEPSSLVTPEQLSLASQWNTNILLGQVGGATEVTFKGEQATGGAHDFAQKSFDLQQDLMSGDMEMTNDEYGWFRLSVQLLGHRSTSLNYTYQVWREYYKVVFSANGILDLVGTDEYSQLPSSLSAENKRYWGMSKVLRGYAYFGLAQFYARPYETDKSNKVLPLPRTAASNAALDKSTLEEVYKLVISDLTEGRQAISEAGIKRTALSDVDEDVATAYLAYAYLQIGDYANAYTEAKKIIDGGNYSLLTPATLTTDGFNNVKKNPEFIWGIDVTQDNTGALTTFWGHVDVYTYSYAFAGMRKVINLHLYNEMPDTDLRKKWFSATSGLPLQKFFSESNTEKKAGGDRTWTSDIHFMRLADMYLVAIEAAARKGDDTEAKRLLKGLMAQRTEAANVATVNNEIDALSHDQLLDRIYFNWRVELWGEGRSLMTAKRFKKNLTRSTRSQYYPGETFPYTDARFTYETPIREVANNPYF